MTPDGGAAAPPIAAAPRADAVAARGGWPASSTKRRCCSASALIPGVLGALFFAQTGQRHPLQSETALRAVRAGRSTASISSGCWSVRGQTLAMQTWRIRVVAADGAPPDARRARWPATSPAASPGSRRRRSSPSALHLPPWPSLGAVGRRDRRLRAARAGRAGAPVLARPRSAARAWSTAAASRRRACAQTASSLTSPVRMRTTLLDRGDEDLAVADLAGLGGLDDRVDAALGVAVLDDDLDLHLGQEVDDVLGAAVELGVALLPAEALDLGDGQARTRRSRPAPRALPRA